MPQTLKKIYEAILHIQRTKILTETVWTFESIWLQSGLRWTQYINILFKLLLDTVHEWEIPYTLDYEKRSTIPLNKIHYST